SALDYARNFTSESRLSPRTARLDAGYFLWNRSIRNSNHRAVGLQANETDAGQGQAPVGDLRRSSSRDSMDFTRDRVAFPGGRRSGASGQSDAHLVLARRSIYDV